MNKITVNRVQLNSKKFHLIWPLKKNLKRSTVGFKVKSVIYNPNKATLTSLHQNSSSFKQYLKKKSFAQILKKKQTFSWTNQHSTITPLK